MPKGKKRKESRRNIRIRLPEALKVVMGSLGAEVRYDLGTRNISHTGFFLDFEKPGRFPFTASSIMEIWLELEPGKSVFFTVKWRFSFIKEFDWTCVTCGYVVRN